MGNIVFRFTLAAMITALLATLAHAVFVLPDEITVAGRIAQDGTLRTDVVQDGVDSALVTPPELTLVGLAYIDLALGAAYSEPGATCTDSSDGAIAVLAPTFSPALNINVAGLYTATYTCTDSDSMTDTITRIVAVGQEAPPVFGPQSSTFAATHGFDFAETFDGLQDWGPDLSGPGSVGDPSKMPRLANGTNSAWTYYSKWGASTDTTPWIGAYGDQRVWRGTKSAAIDLQNEKGPSRLGLFITTPYKGDLYYFYMVNIPKNEFPTDKAPEPDVYNEGDPYSFIDSWKFMTFNYGCEVVTCWEAGSGYSPVHHNIAHIKKFNYTTYSALGVTGGVQPGLHLVQETPASENQNNNTWAITNTAKTALDSWLGDWWGIEFHLKLNVNGTVTRNIWIYDQAGNVQHRMVDRVWNVPGYTANRGWDFFFHGGNNSNSFTWGPTMESVYYIDDVIIDGQRIGPSYFSAIGVTQ